MAAGLGQIVEVVRDGKTDLLYPHSKLDALIAACGRLLSDPVPAAVPGGDGGP